MKIAATMFFLALCVAPGCKTSSRNGDKATPDNMPTGATAGSLQGTIGTTPWKLVRGLAYVDPKDLSKTVIGLFDANGPLGCSIENNEVWHQYPNGTPTDANDVTITVPSAMASYPWQSASADVSVMSLSSPGGGGLSTPADTSLVVIQHRDASSISGTLKADASNGHVEGSFNAVFCQKK